MRRLLPAIVLCLAAVHALAAQTEYAIFIVGNPSGAMVVDRVTANEVEVRYHFNDRGRGPEIEARYLLGENGLPQSMSITGRDYMKAPVEESLTFADGQYRWESSADSGSSDDPAFYSSLDGPPIELGLLIAALQEAPDNSLDMLPSGKAQLVDLGVQEIDGKRLRQVEVRGLGFEPTPAWLDEKGDLFAIVSGWFSVIPEDSAGRIATMKALQDERRDAYFRELAAEALSDPGGDLLIDNVRIFDVVSGSVRDENAVLIRDGVIAELLGADADRPEAARVIDANGQTLLPGLWDMHTHLSLSDGPLHLAAGITTVRDLANDHDQIMQVEERFNDGEFAGPHLFRAGFIDGTGPFAGPTKARIENLEDAIRWIDFYAEHDYDQVKIYSSIPVELVEAMAERAHQHGMRFSGHIPAGMWAEDAVRAGFDEIQHINMVFLNFYKDIVETRNPDRFIKPAERGADLDVTSAPFLEFVNLLKEHNTVIDPTVAVFMDLMTHTPGQLAPSLGTADGRLPPQVIRGNLKGGLAVPKGWEERYKASAKNMLTAIKALHDAGIRLVAGTDGLAGFVLHRELMYYAEAGIAPADILRLATLGSAEVMGVDEQVGQIAPGYRADLIVVDGKPDQDISDITKVRTVIKEGVLVDPAALYRGMAIVPKQAGAVSHPPSGPR